MTGAYQGSGKLNRNQLLDAFHIWCAEFNKCDYFLTLDFKLLNVVRKQKRHSLVEIIKPSELVTKIGIST
jgi:predicted nucleic acid-binding protein